MIYKHKVELQSESETQNSFGGTSNSWVKIRDMRVSIKPISGNESFLSNTDFAKVTHTIKCRYRQDITASNRLVYNDRGIERIFRIISVFNDNEKKRYITIKAVEEVN